jgi:hypothetical protein
MSTKHSKSAGVRQKILAIAEFVRIPLSTASPNSGEFGYRIAWVAMIVLSLLAGCSKAKEPWETVYPASGVVKFQGQPVAGAVVTLIPEDREFPNTVRPTAVTDEDGAFEIGTYSTADGAPAGKYKVLVLHYPVIGSEDNPSAGPNDLPPQYAKAETTTLNVTIEEEETEIPPLELQ